MDIKIYDDEIAISTDDVEEIGELNQFFLRNHTSKQHRPNTYTAKVMVTKSEGNYFSISIRFE